MPCCVLVAIKKVEEEVGAEFQQSFPEEYLTQVEKRELLGLLCLGAYVLLLGKCCRGWGTGERTTRGRTEENEGGGHFFSKDPLKEYQQGAEDSPQAVRLRLDRKTGGQLDVGSFLIGVEVSLRQHAPALTQGLFGPLTNGNNCH